MRLVVLWTDNGGMCVVLDSVSLRLCACGWRERNKVIDDTWKHAMRT